MELNIRESVSARISHVPVYHRLQIRYAGFTGIIIPQISLGIGWQEIGHRKEPSICPGVTDCRQLPVKNRNHARLGWMNDNIAHTDITVDDTGAGFIRYAFKKCLA